MSPRCQPKVITSNLENVTGAKNSQVVEQVPKSASAVLMAQDSLDGSFKSFLKVQTFSSSQIPNAMSSVGLA